MLAARGEDEYNLESVLQRLAAEAVSAGADCLEVEYKNGHEEVVAFKGALGQVIVRLPSSSPEAALLREELRAMGIRKGYITVKGQEYAVCCHVYESFGEKLYHLEPRRTI